jgi:hypothetical protein
VLRIEWICSHRKPSLQITYDFVDLVVLGYGEVPYDFRAPPTGQSLRALHLNILEAGVEARRAKPIEQFNVQFGERPVEHGRDVEKSRHREQCRGKLGRL